MSVTTTATGKMAFRTGKLANSTLHAASFKTCVLGGTARTSRKLVSGSRIMRCYNLGKKRHRGLVTTLNTHDEHIDSHKMTHTAGNHKNMPDGVEMTNSFVVNKKQRPMT